ncbi:hypothetical protein AB0P32_27225 [Streptomyces sp. NPDC085995]|uniref:hypothetical protein n=1 Tax=Streptomyces sp. NPDC085995 TaxID=3154861 RepID=UPI00341541A1
MTATLADDGCGGWVFRPVVGRSEDVVEDFLDHDEDNALLRPGLGGEVFPAEAEEFAQMCKESP